MKPVVTLLCPLVLAFALPSAGVPAETAASPEIGRLTATRQANLIVIGGDHFRVQVDAAKGGEITAIQLFDGSDWNRVVGGDGQTCPMIRFAAAGDEYRLANDTRARIEKFDAGPDRVKFDILATPRDAAGGASLWSVRLGYEAYPEGALFIDIDCDLSATIVDRCRAGVSLVIDRAITRAAKYRQAAVAVLGDPAAFETARIAWGTDPRSSFTNELEAIVEEKRPISGRPRFQAEAGRFTWNLADGETAVRGPLHYHNRFSLGMGSGAAGFRKSNLIGQRVYHWINYLHKDAREQWYPTNAQIDKMAANRATLLVLHDHWMRAAGSNGNPHADYRVARDEDAMRRTIAHAHEKGLRVALYCRNIERYCLDAKFFEKYCRPDWDGVYVDWHGPQCVASHEHLNRPDTALGDVHFSRDGSCLPARDCFRFLRHLRRIVGRRGFLIGHQGIGTAGVLPNLVCDAYLPGEAPFDHGMFDNLDDAVYGGMLGGGVCHPWTLCSPKFCTPEGVAKMAAWGFFPHVGLGMRRPIDGFVFPLDPDDKATAFALPYWRILSAIDMSRARVFNLPNQKGVAATCSDAAFRALVYRARDRSYLVVVSNLGTKTSRSSVNLAPEVLGMFGRYSIERIDAESGAVTPQDVGSTRIETSVLPPWGIEGFRLMPRRDSGK
ncbi:MAG: hypothetical protein WCB27_26050 [Thermoguttaceae bacterium]